MFPFLSFLIVLPILGGFFLFAIPKDAHQNIKNVSLWFSSITLLLSWFVLYLFNFNYVGIQFIEYQSFLWGLGGAYYLGIDFISLSLILLTTLLFFLCFLVSPPKTGSLRVYYASFLILEGIVIGFFSSQNLLLLFLFFEISLIPLFFIIGLFGGENRIQAAFMLFLYTLAGSLMMLFAMIILYHHSHSFDLSSLSLALLSPNMQKVVWLGFFIAFAIKLPLFPFHTWLPKAHVEAPTTGSMMLAAILLKMGAYGMIRILGCQFFEVTVFFRPFLWVLGVASVLYGALIASAQTDIKKLIAYSSVSHMGFIPLGLSTLSVTGFSGAIVHMISHGLVSAGLFFAVGVLYGRFHTRDRFAYGGLKSEMPRFSACFFIMMLASIGFPGTSGFVGEFLVFIALFKDSLVVTTLAGLGFIIGAFYMLSLYQTIFTGKKAGKVLESLKIKQITPVEMGIFVSLMMGIFYIGITPNFVIHGIEKALHPLSKRLASVTKLDSKVKETVH